MSTTESSAFAPKIFEQSEKLRIAAATLAQPPRYATIRAALLSFLATILVGAGLGILTYADLNTYHQQTGQLLIYIMASLGTITGIAALGRSIANTRRLDAISALIMSDLAQRDK